MYLPTYIYTLCLFMLIYTYRYSMSCRVVDSNWWSLTRRAVCPPARPWSTRTSAASSTPCNRPEGVSLLLLLLLLLSLLLLSLLVFESVAAVAVELISGTFNVYVILSSSRMISIYLSVLCFYTSSFLYRRFLIHSFFSLMSSSPSSLALPLYVCFVYMYI